MREAYLGIKTNTILTPFLYPNTNLGTRRRISVPKKTHANMMKRLHTLLVASAITLVASSTAEAQTILTGPDGLEYQITSESARTAILSWQDKETNYGDLTLPTTVTLYDVIEFRVTGMTYHAFNNCDGLTSLTIPDGYTNIPWGAFCNCTNLTTVKMANSVTSVDTSAFWGDDNLQSVTLSDNITVIGDNAFSNCTNLRNIILPTELTEIKAGAFFYSGLASVTIPDKTQIIGREAFSWCKSLKTVELGNSVKTIEESAFANGSLEKIFIPSSVTEIIPNAFYCTTFYEIEVSNDSHVFSSVDGVLYNKAKSEIKLFPAGKNATDIALPSQLTTIGDYAFCGNKLSSITIPTSVTRIGNNAFAGCENLAYITIPSKVTGLGDYAFFGCSKLSNITLSQSISSIGKNAFAYCPSLTSTILPASVTEIGNFAFAWSGLKELSIGAAVSKMGYSLFAGCANLSKVTIDPANQHYTIQDDVIYTKDMTTAVIGLENITSITLPTTVSTVGENAFYYCENLTELNLPTSLRTISSQAFCYCNGLTKATIPEGVTYIGGQAFRGCNNLTEITLPSTLKEFGPWIEDNPTLSIPEGGVLNGCDNLQAIYCGVTTPPLTSGRVTICPFQVYDTATLYIPVGSRKAYEAFYAWNSFKNIVEMDFTEIDTMEATDAVTVKAVDGRIIVEGADDATVEVYAINGTVVYSGNADTIPTFPHGVYIVHVATTTTKVVL